MGNTQLTQAATGSRGDTAHRLAAAAVVVAAWPLKMWVGVDLPMGVEASLTVLIAWVLGWLLRRCDSRRVTATAHGADESGAAQAEDAPPPQAGRDL